VEDYNMTKIFTSQCSIPVKQGKYQDTRCEVTVLWNVCLDIAVFNYVDILLRKQQLGLLRDEVARKEQWAKKHDEISPEDKRKASKIF
jgi:hypothetical protein